MAVIYRIVLQLFLLALLSEPLFSSDFTNDFAVEIDGDLSVADLVASVYGFTFVRKVPELDNVYHFTHTEVARRSKRSAMDLLGSLNSDPNVKWVEQQRLLSREKRSSANGVKEKYSAWEQRTNEDEFNIVRREKILEDRTVGAERIAFNDPHFNDQWYLVNRGQTGGTVGYDLNVLPVWQKGITGRGVVVSILDDGIDHKHPDLTDNYDAEASADLNDRTDDDNDPTPDLTRPDNNHGTRCAGEIAAAANNSECCVGIAYNARIGGVRMLDGSVTDLLEAEAITYNNQYIDIYSASWGPTDDGKTMEGPHRYCNRAFIEGIKKGRRGLGSIYVWATGNGGLVSDYCSCDGYVSSIYTLAVGSVMERGLSTYFSEICPATLAVVFAGGSHVIPGDVNYKPPEIKVVTTDVSGKCTTSFQGTSSAAPLAAGCIALVLEANPNLTWRDVQNIVVETARIPNDEEGGWIVNGGGYHVNHRFGFGVLDCARMVEAAQRWVTVQEQHRCSIKPNNKPAVLYSYGSVNQSLTTDGCQSTNQAIDHLEHVQVHVRMKTERRGDLVIFLTSPAGTRSKLLARRPLDSFSQEYNHTFMTVHSWGENPAGTWVLNLMDSSGNNSNTDHSSMKEKGELTSWSMTLYGVSGSRKNHYSNAVIDKNQEDLDTESEVGEDMNRKKLIALNQAREMDITEVKRLMAEEVASSEAVRIARSDGIKRSKVSSKNKNDDKSNQKESDESSSSEEKHGLKRSESVLHKQQGSEGDVQFLRRLFEAEKRRQGDSNDAVKQESKKELGKHSSSRYNSDYWARHEADYFADATEAEKLSGSVKKAYDSDIYSSYEGDKSLRRRNYMEDVGLYREQKGQRNEETEEELGRVLREIRDILEP